MDKQKIITVNIINRNYPPSPGITGESAAELAAFLLKSNIGINIFFVDANYQGGADIKESEGNLFTIKTFYNGKHKLLRLLGNLYEGYRLISKSRKIKADITICMTDPPLLSMWAALLCKGDKWILWAMDLYPEAFISAGLISKKSIFFKIIKKIVFGGKPSAIIALGPVQRDYLRNIYDENLTSALLPCGIYEDSFDEENEVIPYWAEEDDKIVLGYCGNLGEAHSLDFLKIVIEHLNPQKFKLILAVYGAKAKMLLDFAAGKIGVEIVTSVKRKELKCIDIHLASLTKEWINVCVPSKTVSSVCAGATFLYCGYEKSDNWELLKEAGWLIDPNNLERGVATFLKEINLEKIKEKKNAAARLAKELNLMKTTAFTAIKAKIEKLVNPTDSNMGNKS